MSIIGKMKVKNFLNKYKKFIIFGILLLILLFVFLVYKINFSNNDYNEDNDFNDVIDYEKIVYDYGKKLEEISVDYYKKNKSTLTLMELSGEVDNVYGVLCTTSVINSDGTIYLKDCSVDGNKVKDYEYGSLVIQDETNKIQDVEVVQTTIKVYEKDGFATLKVPDNVNGYKIYEVENDGQMYEILNDFGSYLFYVDDDYNGHMIDYKTKKQILTNVSYDSVYPIYRSDNKKYDSSYIIIRIEDKWSVYDLNTGNKVSIDYDTFDVYDRNTSVAPKNKMETLVGNNIIVKNNGKCGVIDYVTGKIVVPFSYDVMYVDGNYLVTNTELYDIYGKRYLTDIDYVYGVVENKYAIVLDNNKIKIVNVNGNLIYTLDNLSNGNKISKMRSGYLRGDDIYFDLYVTNVEKIKVYTYNYNLRTNNVTLNIYDN